MTNQTQPALAELELREALYEAMDGNLRMSRRRELLAAYRDAILASAQQTPAPVPSAPAARAAILREAADAIEEAQHRRDDIVNDALGFLDNNTEQQHIAVHRSARLLRRMADEAQAAAEPLVHVGWWCWRGDNHGHLATMACRSDNVPIHVPAEWADEMQAVIQRIADGDDPGEAQQSEDEAPPAPLRRSWDDCPGFPEKCPNIRPVDPDPPVHYGGIRCGCADEAHPQCARCGHGKAAHNVSGCLECPGGWQAGHRFLVVMPSAKEA